MPDKAIRFLAAIIPNRAENANTPTTHNPTSTANNHNTRHLDRSAAQWRAPRLATWPLHILPPTQISIRWTFFALLALSVTAFGQGTTKACRRIVVEGEVEAGKGFERVIGGGLKVGLEPIAAGWAVRVVPANGPRGPHDAAELASPPYQSLSPLIVSTGLGFRAQDAIGWNPRRFRYAANPAAQAALQRLYDRVMSSKRPSGADEAELGKLVAASPEATLEILDARLIPGTADQVEAANSVALHFGTTAHQIDQPSDGKGSELGRLEWMRFRFQLDLPPGMTPAPGLKLVPSPCAPRN